MMSDAFGHPFLVVTCARKYGHSLQARASLQIAPRSKNASQKSDCDAQQRLRFRTAISKTCCQRLSFSSECWQYRFRVTNSDTFSMLSSSGGALGHPAEKTTQAAVARACDECHGEGLSSTASDRHVTELEKRCLSDVPHSPKLSKKEDSSQL